MKKMASIWMAVVTMAALFTGCGSTAAPSQASTQSSAQQSLSQPAAPSSQAPSSSQASAESEAPVTEVRIGALKGPTAMGMVKLMEDSKTEDNGYTFNILPSPDGITPKLVQGEFDLAAVPGNLASVLYNNTKGQVQVLAINTLGVLYIVEKGETVQTAADLKGKTIYASGKGMTPEYALAYMLTSNGIDPNKDVTIEYKAEHAECVAALAADPQGIAMLPQPFVATAQQKDPTLRIALDLNKAWEDAQTESSNKSALVTGVLVGRTEFIAEHPEAVAAFLDRYKASVDYVNTNTAEAAKLVGGFDIVPEAVAAKALPYCNIVCIEGEEMKTKLGGYLDVLLQQNPQAVGGAVPDAAFYYTR